MITFKELYDLCVDILYSMRGWAIDIIEFMQREIHIGNVQMPLYLIMFGGGIITFLLIKLVF